MEINTLNLNPKSPRHNFPSKKPKSNVNNEPKSSIPTYQKKKTETSPPKTRDKGRQQKTKELKHKKLLNERASKSKRSRVLSCELCGATYKVVKHLKKVNHLWFLIQIVNTVSPSENLKKKKVTLWQKKRRGSEFN